MVPSVLPCREESFARYWAVLWYCSWIWYSWSQWLLSLRFHRTFLELILWDLLVAFPDIFIFCNILFTLISNVLVGSWPDLINQLLCKIDKTSQDILTDSLKAWHILYPVWWWQWLYSKKIVSLLLASCMMLKILILILYYSGDGANVRNVI